MWSLLLLAAAAVLLINALVASPGSPVMRVLHVSRPPQWLPIVLAGLVGITFGVVLNRRRRPGSQRGDGGSGGGGGSRAPDGRPATRGRYAVPRKLRRQREREARRRAAVQPDAGPSAERGIRRDAPARRGGRRGGRAPRAPQHRGDVPRRAAASDEAPPQDPGAERRSVPPVPTPASGEGGASGPGGGDTPSRAR